MKYEEYTGNGKQPPKQPAELQSDLEAIRAEMSDTLSQLEERFSAREIVDEVWHRVRQASRGGGEFLGNLGQSVRDNPIPVLLIGGGLTALLMSERGGGGAEEGDSGGRAAELKGKAGEAKERAGEAKARAGKAKERATEKAGELRERTARAGERTRERGRRVIQEQPLVLAGLGIALGALVGAGAPMSEREHRTLGKKREELKEEARETAHEVKERGAEAAEGTRKS